MGSWAVCPGPRAKLPPQPRWPPSPCAYLTVCVLQSDGRARLVQGLGRCPHSQSTLIEQPTDDWEERASKQFSQLRNWCFVLFCFKKLMFLKKLWLPFLENSQCLRGKIRKLTNFQLCLYQSQTIVLNQVASQGTTPEKKAWGPVGCGLGHVSPHPRVPIQSHGCVMARLPTFFYEHSFCACLSFINYRVVTTKYAILYLFLVLPLYPKNSPSQVHFKHTSCWLHNSLKCKYTMLYLTKPLLLGIWVVSSFASLINAVVGFWCIELYASFEWVSTLAEDLLCARHYGRLEAKLGTIPSHKMQI